MLLNVSNVLFTFQFNPYYKEEDVPNGDKEEDVPNEDNEVGVQHEDNEVSNFRRTLCCMSC